MEIERKFLVSALPEQLEQYPHVHIQQAYLCTDPVLRIRQRDAQYILTCKGKGLLSREEFELPLSAESYAHLLEKADGRIITKDRYLLPSGERTIELDRFLGDLSPLLLAEVEFPSEEEALAFTPPDWFGKEVTYDPAYTNASLSKKEIFHD